MKINLKDQVRCWILYCFAVVSSGQSNLGAHPLHDWMILPTEAEMSTWIHITPCLHFLIYILLIICNWALPLLLERPSESYTEQKLLPMTRGLFPDLHWFSEMTLGLCSCSLATELSCVCKSDRCLLLHHLCWMPWNHDKSEVKSLWRSVFCYYLQDYKKGIWINV